MDNFHVDGSSDISRQLMPIVIDKIAETEPNATWATVRMSSTKPDARYINISHRQYANAINGIAWWLERELGQSDTTKPIAYFGTGSSDIGYPILLIGAAKAGYYTLFNSPRNSLDANVHLFETQKCHTLIVPEPQPPYVDSLLTAYPMRVLRFPSLETLLNDKALHYPYTKTFEEACHDPLVSIHTSGTTGLPKPRLMSMRSATLICNALQPPELDGAKCIQNLFKDEFIFSAMPMFHAAGVMLNILSPVFCRQRIAFPPVGPPLDAETALLEVRSAKATMAILPPSTLDEIGKTPNLLNMLCDLKYVLAAGSVVSKTAGENIIKKTRLLNLLGTTETGLLPSLEVEQEDWEYLRPSIYAGAEFRQCSSNEYELFVVRNEHLKEFQPVFEILPDLQEYSSHDLFRKHPTKDNHWIYQGRSDDIIVFLNGEKTNPTSMEGLVSGHPDVHSALVLGHGRFEAALLIEPSQTMEMSTQDKANFIERLWPTIQNANSQCPAHARVSKSHVLFTNPGKPMVRASKSTVQRKRTVEMYAAEADAMYADADRMKDFDIPVKIDLGKMQESVHEIVALTMGVQDLSDEEELFSRGMDSLQVIQTARYLKGGLEKAGVNTGNLAPSTIYTNPTIAKLTTAIESFAQHVSTTEESDEKTRVDNINSLLEKYSNFSSPIQARARLQREPLEVIVLTGSTGALGSYLLEALAASNSVSKIYCLNRSGDSERRQSSVSGSRGLTSQWDPQRVTFLRSDLSQDDLGLGWNMYSEIAKNATIVLHNAWQVDFNLSLASFEQRHVKGVRNLIDLSIQSTHQAKIFFISSISSVMNWSNQHTGTVPEEVISDSTVPQKNMGYAESKHISERLLARASAHAHIPTVSCRVGQVAGPVRSGARGTWNKQEWLPSLIQSSTHLGLIPDSLGAMQVIDWIPIDLLADIISTLALAPTAPTARVFHTVNPHATTWSALLPHVQAELGPAVETVSLAVWVQALRASSISELSAHDLDANPAVKLGDFYERLLDAGAAAPRLETGNTEAECGLLSQVGPVKGEWMRRWILKWRG